MPVPPEFVAQQLEAVRDDLDVRAREDGMLCGAAVGLVADRLPASVPTSWWIPSCVRPAATRRRRRRVGVLRPASCRSRRSSPRTWTRPRR
jgi:hypothetical protein